MSEPKWTLDKRWPNMIFFTNSSLLFAMDFRSDYLRFDAVAAQHLVYWTLSSRQYGENRDYLRRAVGVVSAGCCTLLCRWGAVSEWGGATRRWDQHRLCSRKYLSVMNIQLSERITFLITSKPHLNAYRTQQELAVTLRTYYAKFTNTIKTRGNALLEFRRGCEALTNPTDISVCWVRYQAQIIFVISDVLEAFRNRVSEPLIKWK